MSFAMVPGDDPDKSLVLASGSKARAQVLANAGLRFDTVVANVDEESVRNSLRAEGVSVRDQADALAELKAVRVSQKGRGLVIGCDQMLECDGKGYDKVLDLAAAKTQLRALSGKPHFLRTAICVARNGAVIWRLVESPRLTMRPLSDAYIDQYLEAHPEVLSGVGCYHLERAGPHLFSRIEGDYFSILGLPLLPLLDFLRLQGVVET